MVSVQEIFNRVKINKKEQKELRQSWRDALESTVSYKEATEELKKFKEKKKKIEDAVRSDFKPEFDRLEELKTNLESDLLLLNDAALTKLLKGEMVQVVDENEQKYEPVFSVRFKKQG